MRYLERYRAMLGLAGVLLAAPAVAQEGIYVEELDLRLEQVYVTVTRRGEPVPGLGPEDFQLKDDGVAQSLVTAASGDLPFTAVVLMDSSVSMEGRQLRDAVEGVRAFTSAMEENDEVRLAIFDHDLLYASPFVQDPAALAVPTETLSGTGGTAVFDHLYWALRVLELRFGRPVVILLSDGEDVHSILDMTEVREEVRRSQAMLYWLRLEEANADQLILYGSFREPRESDRQLHALEKAVRESGGRVLPVRGSRAIHGALQEVLAELRAQYALGYYPDPPGGDGRWHRLEVKARGARVRVRDGYFAFP